MDVNTLITGSDANALFGDDYDNLLETTLRYIALKYHQGDIADIKPIRSNCEQFSRYADGNELAQLAENGDVDTELFIYTAPRDTKLLYIDAEGWVQLDKPPFPVSLFLSKVSETRVFINNNVKKAIIFVRNATEKWIELLCASMFRVIPWRCNNGEIDKDDHLLFASICQRDSETFTSIVNSLVRKKDLKSVRLKTMLFGWGDGYREVQMQSIQNRINEYHRYIADCQNKISNYLRGLAELNVNLSALQAQNISKDDSVFKFFKTHSDIYVKTTQRDPQYGDILYYSIVDTLEYYDKDEFLRVFNNDGSHLGRAPREVRELLYAIFAENKGAIRVESYFKLINLSSLYPIERTTSGDFIDISIPHPHLYHYACLGANGNYINSYLENGDWDMAIEQTIAATKNVNFGDGAVMSKFINDLVGAYNTNIKFIVADNGTEMTFKEFLEYIRKREEKTDEGTENG